MFVESDEDVRTIKPVPFLYSLLAALLIPPIIAIIFSILGAGRNAILLQLAMVFTMFAFTIIGILRRSKLTGLLSILTAPFAWLITHILSIITYNASTGESFIVNPFGQFSAIAPALNAIVESGILDEETGAIVSTIANLAFVLDLVIVEFIAIFFGFFVSMIATGFWNKKGEFKVISVIFKPIAVIFLIILIVTIPFTYHATTKVTDGVLSLAAGMSELSKALGTDFNVAGTAAQDLGGLDLSDPEVVANLSAAAKSAAYWFRRSARAFDHVRGNLLVAAILNSLPPEYANMDGINVKRSTELLRVVNALASIVENFPELLGGFYHLQQGFNTTFAILGTTELGGGFGSTIYQYKSDYNTDYINGLNEISIAIQNFTDAQSGVIEAIEQVEIVIQEVIDNGTASEEVMMIPMIIGEVKNGYPALLDLGKAAIPFLNGTYETALAIDGLATSDFARANYWLKDATEDLVSSNSTMQNIDLGLFNPDSPMPFYGAVKIIRDMTNLLGMFAMAAVNSTDTYMAISSTLEVLNNMNMSDIGGIDWSQLDSDLSAAETYFNAARSNIDSAVTAAQTYSAPDYSYGELIDGSIKPVLSDFTAMLTTFSQNVTDVGSVITSLRHTITSMRNFIDGMNNFDKSVANLEANGSNPGFDFEALDTTIAARKYFEWSIDNASKGAITIDEVTFIGNTQKDTWKHLLWPVDDRDPRYFVPGTTNSLWRPIPYDPDTEEPLCVASISEYALTTMDDISNALASNPELVEDILSYIESIDLSSIFGGGG